MSILDRLINQWKWAESDYEIIPVNFAKFEDGCTTGENLVSLNRLSVDCGTTPRRQSGDSPDFWIFIRVWLNSAATSRILVNRAVIFIF